MWSEGNPLYTDNPLTQWCAYFKLYTAKWHTFDPSMPPATHPSLHTTKMAAGKLASNGASYLSTSQLVPSVQAEP
eukprot:12155092-Ditylum_brightwellii.AAC.1